MVLHTLHNEFLNEEFQSLMESYNLNLTLPETHEKSRGDLGAKQGVESLSVSSMKLIEVVFEKDFSLGGYKMLSSNFPTETMIPGN